MSDKPGTPDYNALAKRYLDLWQEQVAKLAREPGNMTDAAKSWSDMAAGFMQNVTKAGSAPNPFAGSAHEQPVQQQPVRPAADRTPPASPSPGDGGVDPANLLRRIDDLERRIAAMESKGAAKRPRKPRAPRSSPGADPSGGGGSNGPKPE